MNIRGPKSNERGGWSGSGSPCSTFRSGSATPSATWYVLITDNPPQELTWEVAVAFRQGILQTFSDFYPGVYTEEQLKSAELNPPPAVPVRKQQDTVDETVPKKQGGAGTSAGAQPGDAERPASP